MEVFESKNNGNGMFRRKRYEKPNKRRKGMLGQRKTKAPEVGFGKRKGKKKQEEGMVVIVRMKDRRLKSQWHSSQ